MGSRLHRRARARPCPERVWPRSGCARASSRRESARLRRSNRRVGRRRSPRSLARRSRGLRRRFARPSASATTSRKPLSPRPGVGRAERAAAGRAARPSSRRRGAAEALHLRWRRLDGPAARAARRRVLSAARRACDVGPRRSRARCARGLCLDLADRLFERQPLAGDLGFARAAGSHAAKLRHQRRARPLVKRTPVLAGVLVQAGDGAGDQAGGSRPSVLDPPPLASRSGLEGIVHQDCVLPLRAGRQQRDRAAYQFLDPAHIFDRLRRQIAPRSGRPAVASCQPSIVS